MDINAIGGIGDPAIATLPVSTGNANGDFLATLNTAKKNYSNKAADPVRESKPVVKTAFQELEEYLRKSEAQRLREKILKQMGLTEDALNAMPPKERASVEAAIAKKVKEYLLAHQGGEKQADNSISKGFQI